MEQIWKYELYCDATAGMDTTIVMPRDSQVLTAQLQGEEIVLWVKVKPDTEANIYRHFTVIATGEPITDDPLTYIATVQLRFGFVGHVFERNV